MGQFIAEQHSQWHQIHGKYQTCPLDCGAGESVNEAFENDAEALKEEGAHRIRCGSCKELHASKAMVKLCHEVKRDAETFERNNAAMEEAIATGGDCEHGLSKALCVDPITHYPADR